MGFPQAISSAFSNYANFSGRAVNSEYWWWFVFESLVLGVLGFLTYVFLFIGLILRNGIVMPRRGIAVYRPMMRGLAWNPPLVMALIMGIVLLLVALGLLLPGLALSVRRLHDAGFSGWLVLIALIPFGKIVLLALLAMESSPEGMKYGY
ncbi:MULTISPECIES: DUF805 domain-containing protein [Arthrobacter]|uniref:DUF805 domain-containing protein n=2 Tax=Arthrobacter TaxID=1663 RepID=A0ABU9KJW2_9MICC|nr:DUF805 domain-containing protein [Arthrobacter sp. YJM1]MDP5227152.1 DUF805 domain-containing protein [Arthrobacter sp. YJM1]